MGALGTVAQGFRLLDEAELKLDAGRWRDHAKSGYWSAAGSPFILTGKVVTKLALDWQQRIQFVMCDDGSIKRLRCDELRDQNE